MPTNEPAIHPTAIIAKGARIGSGVTVGAYSIIEDGVEVGDNCVIAEHVILRRGTKLEQGVQVDSTTVIGGVPQDLSFNPSTPSGVVIGAGTVIREGVTIHRATSKDGATRVGEAVFLMGGVHVAHDCVVGDRAILANDVLLAGHVSVGSYAFLGGGAVFHQYVRVGESAMVSGGSRIGCDVPPFLIVAERNEVSGLNLVGLRRRGLGSEVIGEIRSLYRIVYSSGTSARRLALESLEKGIAKTREGINFLKYFEPDSKRGYVQPSGRIARRKDSQ